MPIIPYPILQAYCRQVKAFFRPWTFLWSNAILSEVNPNVERSLNSKFSGCNGKYGEAKIAGLYTFWIAKLKPAFSLEGGRVVNERLAFSVGFSYIRERLSIDICLNAEEMENVHNTLRYHTSSPHTMMHLYEGWIERERLRCENVQLKKELERLQSS
ncbi:MAG: hypothetical protein IJU37_11885 [Desulfovibrio sp.]|nr:hypothetical protein [Desulfovibrio sp.]